MEIKFTGWKLRAVGGAQKPAVPPPAATDAERKERERLTKRLQTLEDDGALQARMVELHRLTGVPWWFSRQENRRYALMCQVDQPPLLPGGPMVFVRNLTGLQLRGVINAMHYALAGQAAVQGEDAAG